MNLKVGVILLVNALELVRTDVLHQLVVYVVDLLLKSHNVLSANEFIVIGLQQSDGVSEIGHFVLVRIVEDIVILDQIFGNDQVVVHHEPHLLSTFILQTAFYGIVPLREVNLPLPE